MSDTLGAAVVGTGFGVLTHVRALDAAGIEVRALVGRDPDKTAKRAERFGIEHATTDRREAFARDDVDVVAVTTPPHAHAEVVLEAVAAGKHVLCEKPFARDLAEAREMLRAADAAGVVHLLGTEFRFAPGQALLTRAVRSGAIGDPRFVLFVLQLPTLTDPAAEMPAWWDDAAEGGGWLGAQGTHVIDQVRTTIGDITRVSATLMTLSPRPMTADDTYTVQFETESGATGLLHSSCAAGGQFVVATKVTGTAGTAWTQGDEVWVDTGAGPDPVAGSRRPARGRAGAAAERAAAHDLRHVALHRHGPRALHAPLHGHARTDPGARSTRRSQCRHVRRRRRQPGRGRRHPQVERDPRLGGRAPIDRRTSQRRSDVRMLGA